jgi:phosphoribosyl 1,2-cyclic phosphodiesterase
MRLTIWGCRGSMPTPGPDTVRYGGNTSCVEVTVDEETTIVLDAGTGIRNLGAALADRGARRVHICLTHLHLDHLEGLRFFAPLWNPEVEIDIWGPRSPVAHLRDRIAKAFSPPLFPVDLADVPARVQFRDAPQEAWSIGGARIEAHPVAHPGPTLGYRIRNESRTVAYIPDHEPALGGTIAGRPRDWISGAEIAANADLLLHDAQYFADEYEERVGWGHSSVDDAIAFTESAGAKRLVLFHHEPRHSDDALDRLEERARTLRNGNGPAPTLAREGMVLELP